MPPPLAMLGAEIPADDDPAIRLGVPARVVAVATDRRRMPIARAVGIGKGAATTRAPRHGRECPRPAVIYRRAVRLLLRIRTWDPIWDPMVGRRRRSLLRVNRPLTLDRRGLWIS